MPRLSSSVKRKSKKAVGQMARRRVPAPSSTRPIDTQSRAPMSSASKPDGKAATGSTRPGKAVRRPVAAYESPRSCWISGRTGGIARITERKLKPTSVSKPQTMIIRQVTVIRSSCEVDTLFCTKVSNARMLRRTGIFTIPNWQGLNERKESKKGDDVPWKEPGRADGAIDQPDNSHPAYQTWRGADALGPTYDAPAEQQIDYHKAGQAQCMYQTFGGRTNRCPKGKAQIARDGIVEIAQEVGQGVD